MKLVEHEGGRQVLQVEDAVDNDEDEGHFPEGLVAEEVQDCELLGLGRVLALALPSILLLRLSDFLQGEPAALVPVEPGDVDEPFKGSLGRVFGDEADGSVLEEDDEDDGNDEHGEAVEDQHDHLEVGDEEEPQHIAQPPDAENGGYHYLVLLPFPLLHQLGYEYVGQVVGYAYPCREQEHPQDPQPVNMAQGKQHDPRQGDGQSSQHDHLRPEHVSHHEGEEEGQQGT